MAATAREHLAELVDALGSADLDVRAAAIARARDFVDAPHSVPSEPGEGGEREVVAVPVVVIAAVVATLASIEDAVRQLHQRIDAKDVGERGIIAARVAPVGGPHGGLFNPPPETPPPLPENAVADVKAALAADASLPVALADMVVGYGPWRYGSAVRASVTIPVHSRVLTVQPGGGDGGVLTVEALDVDGRAILPGTELPAGTSLSATLRVNAEVPVRGVAYIATVVGTPIAGPAAPQPAALPPTDPEAEARLAAHRERVAAMQREGEAKAGKGQ